MYYFNLSLLNYRDWRIQHALSHHLYPNSLYDLEVKLFEPFLCWTPNASKNVIQRYVSWLYSPLIYAVIFIAAWSQKLVIILYFTNKNAYELLIIDSCVAL